MTSTRPAPTDAESTPRELLAVREIAGALLRADRASDVYQFALDRVTPLLGAAFSVVMQLGDDGDLLRPVAQHEWPTRHRAWIGALRVRVGDGPSGMAVAERRVVEVRDLFEEPAASDPALAGWHEVARELGFRSIVAAPLLGARRALGAIVFYFVDATSTTEEQGALVRLVADQLATAAEKAATIDALRRANGALAEANAELEQQVSEAERIRADGARLLEQITTSLTAALAPDAASVAEHDAAGSDALAAARAIATAARELVQLRTGTARRDVVETDPRAPLLQAAATWRARVRTVPIMLGEPTSQVPAMLTEPVWLTRLLELMLGIGVSESAAAGSRVEADVALERGFVALRVRWRRPGANGSSATTHPAVTVFDRELARAIAVHLGGELRLDDDAEGGLAQVAAVFPLEVTA